MPHTGKVSEMDGYVNGPDTYNPHRLRNLAILLLLDAAVVMAAFLA